MLLIDGLEATQAIQFYRSRAQLGPRAAEPDNSVPLIAGKPLVLRLYPDARVDGGEGLAISRRLEATLEGELLFRQEGSVDLWHPALRFPGAVAPRAREEIDRGDPTQTLNFRIPAESVRGTLRVRARVWIEDGKGGRVESAWREEVFSVEDVPPFRIRLHGVRYTSRGEAVGPPTAIAALETIAFLRKAYPVGQVEILEYDTLELAEDLDDSEGAGCGRGWSTLLLLLERMRVASGGFEIHHALLPPIEPSGVFGGFGGCGAFGVSASFAGSGAAMAQEVCHALGRLHAPGVAQGSIDPAFPQYGRYPRGSIGEPGFDPQSGEVHSPSMTGDFMGSSSAYWVSPYTYRALLDLFARGDGSDRDDDGPHRGARADEHLRLQLSLGPEHEVTLHHGVTLPGEPLEPWGRLTSCRIELQDEEGRVLAATRVRGVEGPAAGPQGREVHALVSLPSRRRARRLVVRCCGSHEPKIFELPRDDLRVEILSGGPATAGEPLAGMLDLRWSVAGQPPDRIAIFLRYTADGGTTWKALDAGLDWGRSRIDLDLLPGGDRCRLQVIASTVLRTATAQTLPFRVAFKPRRAAIAGVEAGEDAASKPRTYVGPFLDLLGTAHSPQGFAAEVDLVWTSSLQGRLGRGSHLVVEDPLPGEHRIVLEAPDGAGGVTRAEAIVSVLRPGTGRAVAGSGEGR